MRLVNFSVIACILLCTLQNGSGGRIGDFLGQVTLTAGGALKELPFKLKTPNEIFERAKNVVLGFPSIIAFDIVHEFCSTALNTKTLSVAPKFTPQLDKIQFILRTKLTNVEIPITNPDDLWKNPAFNHEWPLVIFVTGWKTNLMEGASKAQDVMAEAYLCRGNVNFVTVDTAAYVDTLYAWSAFNTETIGQYISQALQKLVAQGYSTEKIHLIGHSLGAHICGATGRIFNQATEHLVRRITGLDPANPCFNNGGALTGLGRGDAEWVDIIHSNPGALGKKDAIGDCDFYPNGIDLPLQPGTFDITASHSRAWKYYAETVYPGNEENFLARKCTSMKELDSRYCNGKLYPMGYAAPFNLKGNYFLRTKPERPFGENSRMYSVPTCAN